MGFELGDLGFMCGLCLKCLVLYVFLELDSIFPIYSSIELNELKG